MTAFSLIPDPYYRHRRIAIGIVGACCLLFGSSKSQAQSADPFAVSVDTIDEQALMGRLISSGDQLQLDTGDGNQRVLSRDSILRVTPVIPVGDQLDPDAVVLLINGDCLAGAVTSIAEDSLTLQWQGGDAPTMLTVPLESIQSVVLQQPADETERVRLRRQWGLQHAAADRMLMLNGTYVEGELTRLDDVHLVMQTKLGPVETLRENVAAITLNAELSSTPNLPDRYAVALVSDGSRITLDDVQFADGGGVSGKSVFGTVLTFPLDCLVRLQTFGNGVVSLADMRPSEYVFTPYLNEQHPLVKHRNVHGGLLQLRGSRYAVGLGMHSRSEARFDLTPGGFTAFTATVGIDDMAKGQGNVTFAVEVDGTRMFEAEGRSVPLQVGPIDVSGAKQLTLIVDFGRLGNIQDVADWCDPLLIK